ncbi:MAG: GDP-L-fucose synthase, partial [Planctomycetota bacterium]
VEDLAAALCFLLKHPEPPDWINVGTGVDISILDLAATVAETVGYQGQIKTDPSRPDGTMLKRTDVSLLNGLGWKHETELRDGLKKTYQSFLQDHLDGALRSV